MNRETEKTPSFRFAPRDHIINIIKAILNTVPYGGGVASLISDYIPAKRARRVEDFLIQVSKDLVALEKKINEDQVKSEAFSETVEICLQKVLSTPQSEKTDLFKGLLLRSAMVPVGSNDEIEYMLNMVDSLTLIHLKILSFMENPQEYLSSRQIDPGMIQGGFSNFFPKAIPEAPITIIKSAFADLFRMGLINTNENIFATMTSAQGLHLLGDRVSEYGKKFIEYCRTRPD